MAALEKYNYLVDAVVKKIYIESGVKISDVGDEERKIVSRQYPSIMMDLYHTNHQYYEKLKCDKFAVKFVIIRNYQDLLSVLMPGSIIDRIHIMDKRLVVQNRLSQSAIIMCNEILIKAKV